MTNNLPSGWAWTRIENVAHLVRGVTFKKPEASSEPGPGLVPIARAGNVKDDRANLDRGLVYVPHERVAEEQYLRSGDILLATSSGSLSVVGKSALITQDWHGAHGAFMAVLRPCGDVEPAFLGYFVQSEYVRKRWRQAAAGTNINNLKKPDLLSTEVPLCSPGAQRRIVAAIEEHLSRLDAVEFVLRKNLRQLETLRSTTLVEAFHSSRSVPPHWNWMTIGDVAEVRGGIQKQPQRRPNDNPAPFLRVANVLRGELLLDEIHQIELFDGELEKYRLHVGDLLVVEGNGSPQQIGRAACWGDEIPDCVHQNHLIRVRPGPRLASRYLALYWNAPHTASALRDVASSTSGLYTLSTRKIKSIPIPLAPLREQRSIVEEVDQQLATYGRLEQSMRRALDRLGAVRRSVLAVAFSGRLVPQDPHEEFAGDLLERIAVSRRAVPTRQEVGA